MPKKWLEIIPPIVAFVLVAAVVGLMFEFAIAASRGVAADPVAVTTLGGLAGACLTALVPLYIVTTTKRPPDDYGPREPERRRRREDVEEDEPPERPGWLELVAGKVGRWTPCSIR